MEGKTEASKVSTGHIRSTLALSSSWQASVDCGSDYLARLQLRLFLVGAYLRSLIFRI